VQPGIMVQRARETSGTSASRLSRTSCKSWLLPFLLRRALPDIPEQYMRALQDARMCNGTSTQAARAEDLPQRTSTARRRMVRAGMTREGQSRCAAHLQAAVGIVKSRPEGLSSLFRGSPRDGLSETLGTKRAVLVALHRAPAPAARSRQARAMPVVHCRRPPVLEQGARASQEPAAS